MHSGAAAAAIAQAIKASGAIVRMDPNDFQQIVARADEPLVVMSIRVLVLESGLPCGARAVPLRDQGP